tara:strand:+ start:626 stop:979 length:354 start_codon:yes stop_codon:yes gene_type:complete
MASTRNKNTMENYQIEQRQYRHNIRYNTNVHSQYGEAYTTYFPGFGLNPAQLPRQMISNNAIEMESYLKGINTTNLVNPMTEPKLQDKNMNEATFFNRVPLFVPAPMVVHKDQRPTY